MDKEFCPCCDMELAEHEELIQCEQCGREMCEGCEFDDRCGDCTEFEDEPVEEFDW